MKENTRGLVRVARGFLGNRALYPLVLQKPLAVCEVVIKKWLPFKSCCNSIMVELCPNGYIHALGRYKLAFSQHDPHNFSHSLIYSSIQVGVSVAVRQFTTYSSDSSYEWSLYCIFHAEKAQYQGFRDLNTVPHSQYQWYRTCLSWTPVSALQAALHV